MIKNLRALAAAAGLAIVVAGGLAGCGIDEDGPGTGAAEEEAGTISLSGKISQVYQTRADDSGFADKDEIGVYIVDYNGATPGTLKGNGDRADNVRFTFDERSYKWTPDNDIYWKDSETHIDVYGYYPYSPTIDKVNEYAFEVRKDQNTESINGSVGGYEASDFLWGKAEDAAPTDRIVRISFTHRMAGIRVTLAKGTGFSDEEWAAADKEVLILNTKRGASVDLTTGTVTATGKAEGGGIVPYRKGADFRAVVAPQEVAAGTRIISVTVDGTSYSFSRDENTVFHPSRQHNFTVTVNKKGMGDFEFKVSGESVTAWENDAVSHDAIIKEYVVIDVETPGTLEKCVKAAGKDLAKIKNLKLTGTIGIRDFMAMQSQMSNLRALNLKEVTISSSAGGKADAIPVAAFKDFKLLSHITLPERLSEIGKEAFCNCTSLIGSLEIPEGVTSIGADAFSGCGFKGSLSLPESLNNIGDGAFRGCKFNCELILPSSLEHIGHSAFSGCGYLYGEIKLPDSLKSLGSCAFYSDGSFTGGLRIPKNVTSILNQAFEGCCGLNGQLILHDGITTIDTDAFRNCPFTGELTLPESLGRIGAGAFRGCSFSKLTLSTGISSIEANVFKNNQRLRGTLEIPPNISDINSSAFEGCTGIEKLILPQNLDIISGYAFANCFGINKIVCKSNFPPTIRYRAFDGVPKDNFTVEVPESAVAQYKTANGWKDFKRISAYRNFVIRPDKASALNSRTSRELILDADDEWSVESMPGWVKLSQTEGKGKTELRLDFLRMPSGTSREGDIVFKLNGKDYRTTCHVTQYDYSHAEDEVITMQKASKGDGVNIVFLGDGYSAKNISEGLLLSDIDKAVGYFFGIEPYKTYREYFNVYTAVALSPESGIGGVNTIINNRFNTTFLNGADIGGRSGESDHNEIFEYACKAPTVDEGNLNRTLIVIVPNTTIYSGTTYMYSGGEAISYCPKSDSDYPYDFRGIIQHEAGGHGFAKLADEYIHFNAFANETITAAVNAAKKLGWYENISLTGKRNEVPWSHLIFDKRYSSVVDIYEGGFTVSRGVFRSEANSCMNNNVPYYSAISRETIVKRIMEYAGQEYSFEDFVANDKIDGDDARESAATRGGIFRFPARGASTQSGPVFMGRRGGTK